MKEIEIPEGYEAKIKGNKVIIERLKSENERIRKEIIRLIQGGGYVLTKVKEEMLSYLENQKEQKHAEQLDGTFTSYDMAKTFMEGQNYVVAHPEKFSLCKPAEWSEEDEAFLKVAIAICNRYSHKDIADWLKSLRPQPKAELTLLDENIINAAVAFVEQNNHFNCWRGIDKHTVIKALRSLKPHWKPSEYTLSLVKKIADGEMLTGVEQMAMGALYEQLKSL